MSTTTKKEIILVDKRMDLGSNKLLHFSSYLRFTSSPAWIPPSPKPNQQTKTMVHYLTLSSSVKQREFFSLLHGTDKIKAPIKGLVRH